MEKPTYTLSDVSCHVLCFYQKAFADFILGIAILLENLSFVNCVKCFIVIFNNTFQMSGSDRSLINAFREITTMADRINLPAKIVVRASMFHSFSLFGYTSQCRELYCSFTACIICIYIS